LQGLCSLQGLVRELEYGADGCASFVPADAEDDRWLPEVKVRYLALWIRRFLQQNSVY
jgi:hypothetical protein